MAAKRIGIAIVEHAGRYLVGVRGPEQALAGCAEFPGGKCEPEESPQDCAVRECLEETGLAVVAERLLEQTTFAYPHGEVELHFWLCRVNGKTPLAADHCGFRWVTAEELRSLPFPEANRSVVAQLTAEDRL
jgi:8-oxo-dGTP diphosphatase